MLKFILFLIVLFLVIRLVLRTFGLRVLFRHENLRDPSAHSSATFSSGRRVEETDYEIVDSHLNDPKRNGD